MRAIILAAGRGSRMKNKTESNPKCLVELRGRPLLEWQLEALTKAGIEEIAIVTGYKKEMLSRWALKEFNNPRWAETNMLSSLACASDWLEEGPCIVSYSDIFYAPKAVESLMQDTADLAITYDPRWLELWSKRFDDPLTDAETFRMNTDSTLIEIGNRASSLDEIEGQYMGLLRISPAGWQELEQIRASVTPEVRDAMHMTGVLQRVISAARVPVHALPFSGEWGEVDTPEDLAVYHEGESGA